ncbi:helix-turn-helix transcriptional regulator [Paenibacillus tritici]|uniref:helix-turn-helix transcriptional regulator n=1 Tax=Paenibacillus tritici TaxID=1873425 RepID=UPI001BA75887|nr:helix-turn-helix transcriptional regulator [Paenibacillus tritici]QUL57526.1 helix-turn-helix transcriptional regulator [Paenibacillus tritici]
MHANTETANESSKVADINLNGGLDNKKTLREWRVKRFKSKQDLAELLNVHPSTYAKMELKPEEMRLRHLVLIVDYLECNLSDILFFEQNSKNN